MELQHYLHLCTKTELAMAKRSARLGETDVISALHAYLVSMAQVQGIDLPLLLERRQAERHRHQQAQEARRQSAIQRHQEKLAARAINLQTWNAWFDGSAQPNPGPCSIGVVLQAPDGRRWQLSRQVGYGSSSDAEYQALIAALGLAIAQQAQLPQKSRDLILDLSIRGDSRVVLDDVLATDEQSSPVLSHWREQARALLQQLPNCQLMWIPRARNGEADQLAAQARL